MAAPPKVSASQMRAAQQAKSTEYANFIKTVADSLGNQLILQLERKLQEAIEDFRPRSEVSAAVVISGIEPLDRLAAANRIREMVVATFGAPRNFTVIFDSVLDPDTKLPTSVFSRLTWGTP